MGRGVILRGRGVIQKGGLQASTARPVIGHEKKENPAKKDGLRLFDPLSPFMKNQS